jgi:ribosome maturation factor RimP
VSSPGLFRKLTTGKDWLRALGKRVKVRRASGETVVGTLLSVTPILDTCRIHDGVGQVRTPLAGAAVNLEPILDFGDR